MPRPDWNPDLYARFGDVRLQPAIDLAARIGALPPGALCDLGCGAGVAGALLRGRFPERALIGVDSSPAMLEKAGATGRFDVLVEADAAAWAPHESLALIFSNALLHWLPDHQTLLPRLVGHLAPGGVLAVQMPHQNGAPSHRLWHDLAAQHFPGRFDPASASGILEPTDYVRILSPLGEVALWETEYFQQLAPAPEGHPVRLFTSSTFARPVLGALSPAEAAELIRHYDAAVSLAYPPMPDGSVLFPFRRLFFLVQVPGD
ncbi:methyltransferase domain-containing protein [Antarcticimicrobium luteum]|uniref:Methyltransferase domain-containing protein n=1 Tax=Antarcticimicrobium luteum TaxID=2547397 RepID=A0A4R5V830_9RHOB|nr:methyltransferase domain-containing protein [Antarcticimicrobium luteum]TDK48021.1 methyltransferase domain-containing protein [Antarcticimicrobium luteum]